MIEYEHRYKSDDWCPHLVGVRVHVIYPVPGAEAGVGGHAGRDEAHAGGAAGVGGVVVEGEVVVVGVAVELGRHRVLEPGDDPGVLPAPGAQTLRVARRHVAQDVDLVSDGFSTS